MEENVVRLPGWRGRPHQECGALRAIRVAYAGPKVLEMPVRPTAPAPPQAQDSSVVRRLAAGLIDAALCVALSLALFFLPAWGFSSPTETVPAAKSLLEFWAGLDGVEIAFFVLFFLFLAGFTSAIYRMLFAKSSWHTTPGKIVAGLARQ